MDHIALHQTLLGVLPNNPHVRIKSLTDSSIHKVSDGRANLAKAKMGAQVFKPLATTTLSFQEMIWPRRERLPRQVLLALPALK